VLRDWLERLHVLGASLPEATPARLRPVAGLDGSLAWLEGRHDDARRHWNEVLAHESASDLLAQGAEVRVRLAALEAGRGDRDAAAAALRPLLADAAAGPRGVVYAAPELAVLAQLDWGKRIDAAALATLQAWAKALARNPAPAATTTDAPDSSGAAERLTARELEVIALIARGASNKIIARELDLSPHTVKRHVANILDKLDLRSRGQAAAWWLTQQQRHPRQ
jgi:LuxR family maltose regulon positive regulatory protein